MSETADAVRRAVGPEWISTKAVAEQVPHTANQRDYEHVRTVYKHLDHMARQGYLEKRVEFERTGRVAYWRRIKHEHVWDEHEPLNRGSYVRYTDTCRICGMIRIVYSWNDGEKDVYLYNATGEIDDAYSTRSVS